MHALNDANFSQAAPEPPEQPVLFDDRHNLSLIHRSLSMNDETPIEIDCHLVAARLQAAGSFVLIDCREPDEHAIAHIEGSRPLPMSELGSRLAELEPLRECELVVHCHHGGRSLRVARWLREQGFTGAQSMAGGIDQWSLVIDPKVPRY